VSKYFRSDIPGNSSVTITIKGSLQAPINCKHQKCIVLSELNATEMIM